MITAGRVQNGVIVLSEGVRLPEGQEVAVLSSSASAAMNGAKLHRVLDIPPVHLGRVLPSSADDDLLGDMLAERS
jgi:hypothetical protein